MRPDLLPLSPEALIKFTNAGQIKRAVRELAGGYRPEPALDEAGTLSARFDDGVEIAWPQGQTIARAAARCDCLRGSACAHGALGVWAFRAAAAPPLPSLRPPAETCRT